MKDWKTTVAGLIGGVIIALQTIVTSLQEGTPINGWQIAFSIAFATLGYLAPDKKPSKTVQKVGEVASALLVLVFITPLVLVFSSCASPQTQLVSGTLSNGDKFPLCLEVTEKSPIGGITLLAAFCANAQVDINNKAAQYRMMYGPNIRMTEIIGQETRKLN